jgi:drug/metabolite transporter (DMT)-like permease
MTDMADLAPSPSRQTIDPSMFGLMCCTLSAVAYTAYNVCLRDVSDQCDPAWVNCVQASVGMAVFGVYLVWQAGCGRRALPPWRDFLALVIIGVITQIGGVLLVWSMAVVGVAVSATLQMGVMLAASAMLGRVVLGERISWRQAGAIVLITVSVVLFSRGAQSASEATTVASAEDGVTAVASQKADAPGTTDDGGPLRIVLGIVAGALAGVAFAILTVGIRKTVSGETTPEAVVFLINAMGVIVFGPWCVYRLGVDALVHTRSHDLGVMLSAGVMNLIGFLLITKSLQLLAVVRVNIVNNAVTMALTVIAGIVWFKEPWNADLGLGILLAAIGTVLISMTPEGGSDAVASETKQCVN